MSDRDLEYRTLREAFDPQMLRLGATRIAAPVPSKALLYRMHGDQYLRVELDRRERALLVHVGLGDGGPPAWDEQVQNLSDFPLDFLLEELGAPAVDDTPISQPGAEADPLGLVGSRYADAVVALGPRLRLTQGLVDTLRRRAVERFDDLGGPVH